jgi:Skp family chaperone for outer membrane proteins
VLVSRVTKFFFTTAIIMAVGSPTAFAQSSPGYFIPPSAGSAPSGDQAPRVTHHAEAPAAPMGSDAAAGDAAAAQAQPQLPAIPTLPKLPQEAPPPAAVIGVLSVPEVMQKSTAAEGVQEIIQQRRQKLAQEAQKDQQGWEQEEAKEKGLQNEIAAAQTSFRARDQAIQNSAQVALGQIESVLIAVIRQVSEARGMNLVLHREQVALNINAFDITADVATQLNKLLPSVPVPPSVVTPGMHIDTPQEAQGNQ